MTATSVLIILVGIFVIINAPNFVGVINGDKKLTPSITPNSASNPSPASGPTGTFTGTTDPRAGK